MYDIVHQATHEINIDDTGRVVKDTNKSSTDSVWTKDCIEKELKDEPSSVCEECNNEWCKKMNCSCGSSGIPSCRVWRNLCTCSNP